MADDAELLGAWAGGDDVSGRAFYVRYAERVTRFFARKTNADTADLVQRTFMKCLDTAKRGAVIGDPAGLLFAIARTELYDQYRRDVRNVALFTPEKSSLEDLGLRPSAVVAEREEERLLLAALRTLPLDDQLALELYYWEDLSMEEVARAVGITKSAAINRVHRARERVRAAMGGGAAAAGSVDDFEKWARSLARSDVPEEEPAIRPAPPGEER